MIKMGIGLVFLFGNLLVFSQEKTVETGKKATSSLSWNTWDTYSQVSFVHLPEGLGVNLVFKEYRNGHVLRNPLGYKSAKLITPGVHATDGSYTDQTIQWEGNRFRIQSGTDRGNLVLLITPEISDSLQAVTVAIEAAVLWGGSGTIKKTGNQITLSNDGFSTILYSTTKPVFDPYFQNYSPYSAFKLNSTTGFSTGKPYNISQIETVLTRQSGICLEQKNKFGSLSQIFDALQTSIAWNTVYDPLKKRIITPVSRSWNDWHGGYVLFEWDNYFVAYMASLYDKNLAYQNAMAITHEISRAGFVPNMSDPLMKTEDRSEPPVGAFCVREIYRKYREKWFLDSVYDNLLKWNRWWANRRTIDGLLVWGSNDYKPIHGNYFETSAAGVNRRQGASYESGLDNSPMYLDIAFDTASGLLQQWDVGLNSLYILDCEALADIAAVLDKTADQKELLNRKDRYTQALKRLWDPVSGIYKNKSSDNATFSSRISPTSFYVLLTNALDQKQIDRMMREHFYNPQEFYGQWMIPSVPRNDTSFSKQDYWQGRIWGPMNFLVYLGLRKQHLTDAVQVLVSKSGDLLLKNWALNKSVCENYNTITGLGGEAGSSSDPFYHWGALLGFMQFIEKGYVEDPDKTLSQNKNCVLTKGPLSVVINAENGGRIESFSWNGKELLLQRETEPVYFGSTLWPDPQSNWWPVDSALDGSAYKIMKSDPNSLRLLGTTAKSGLQFEKMFSINAADTSLNITYRIYNKGDQPLSVGPWELIRTPGGLVFFPEKKINGLPNSDLQGIQSKDRILWYDFDSTLIKKDQKLFAAAREGWLAYAGKGLLFIKTYPKLNQNQIAPGQGQVEIFTNAKATYVENETHGEFEKLRPGAFSTYRVNWYLRNIPTGLACTKGSPELVEYVNQTLKGRSIKQ